MRVMGIDPGLTRCGVGVVDQGPGRTVEFVKVGVLRTTAHEPHDDRLRAIADGIDQWLDAFTPDVVAIERVFAQNNVSTVIATAQVTGIAIVAAARRGLLVAQHTPSEVKAAVTGNGSAPKEQVQNMVVRILGLSAVPKPADAADALALAICHMWRPAGVIDRAGRLPHTPAQRAWAAAEQAARRTK
ncbi:Holliday junction endonuclease RuvC [Micrococcales bacterium KH10]|nr:Holliday junction endonuclease RuvC [Micrococcales bacterium KH10]